MAATEGKWTLFNGELMCAIVSQIAYVVLALISLGFHIKLTHWCSFTSSIFTYLVNIFLFSFSFMIFSFYSWLIHIIILYLTLTLFFFFVVTFLLALLNQIEGRWLDEPKLLFVLLCPMWTSLIGITIWLSLGNHATFSHILIGFFIAVVVSLTMS